MRTTTGTCALLALLAGLVACGEAADSTDADGRPEAWDDGDAGEAAGEEATQDPDLAPLPKESGFVVLEPVTYQVKTKSGFTAYTSDEARVYVSFQPSSDRPETKPLAVFFNGGPGSATDFLLAFNTGEKSLDPEMNGGTPVGPSPADWSEVANLLYVDARNTGFSYSIGKRMSGMTVRNFNPIFDAADFVRVVLRVLAERPALRGNPVVLVGESYGGTRATLMLHLLLFHDRYGEAGDVYRDPALVDEIRGHFAAVLGDRAGAALPPEVVARQFGRQVLIQPYFLGDRQDEVMGELFEEEGSPPYQLAAETGEPFTPCKAQASPACNPEYNAFAYVTERAGRDLYKYDEPSTWSTEREDEMLPVLLSPLHYQEFLDQDPRTIAEMYASQRIDAYKGALAMPGAAGLPAVLWRLPRRQVATTGPFDLEAGFRAVFGALAKDDAYYAAMNLSVWALFEASPFSYHTDTVGGLFLEVLLYADTFLTAAGFDLICYSPAVPITLGRRADVQSVSQGSDALTVTYAQGAFPGLEAGTTRTMRFVPYAASGHSVPMAEPVKLLNDVRAWAGW